MYTVIFFSLFKNKKFRFIFIRYTICQIATTTKSCGPIRQNTDYDNYFDIPTKITKIEIISYLI
jgi:hypothetical protein